MAQWEYRTLMYGAAQVPLETVRRWQYWVWPWAFAMRRWVITASDAKTAGQQVGEAEKGRFVGRIWQAQLLLETALRELDADGWELVSVSFSGILSFYGCAVLKRRAVK